MKRLAMRKFRGFTVFDHAELLPGTIVKRNNFATIIHYQDYTLTLFKDGRMNVHGLTEDTDVKTLFNTINKSFK